MDTSNAQIAIDVDQYKETALEGTNAVREYMCKEAVM